MTRKLIFHDGDEQSFCSALNMQQVKAKLSASSLLAIRLDDHLMFCDDTASLKDLPANEAAMTVAAIAGYNKVIRGNVLITPEADFSAY